MTVEFDAYRKWLGIPPEEQPPNHYRLLGIGLFESDPDVIANAADRQMAHVRTFQTGKHSAVSQKLLNELAAARICLLDAKKREAYDSQLRDRLETAQTFPAAQEAVQEALSFGAAAESAGEMDFSELPSPDYRPARAAASYITKHRKRSIQGPFIAAGIAMVTLLLLAWLFLSGVAERLKPNAAAQTSAAAPSKSSAIHQGSPPPAAAPTPEPTAPPKPPMAKPDPVSSPRAAVPPKLARKTNAADKPQQASIAPQDVASLDDVPPVLEEPEESRKSVGMSDEPFDSDRRLPLPDEADRQRAEAVVREVLFKEEFRAADRSPKNDALGKILLHEGLRLQDDPAATYVLLRLASEEAASSGDIATTFSAIDAMVNRFQTDALHEKIGAFEQLAKGSKLTGDPRLLLINRMMEAVDDAAEANRFDFAERVIAQAKPLAAKTRDSSIVKQWNVKAKQVHEDKAIYERIEQARKSLASSPNDPSANEQVGKYDCFEKGNWDRGLPRLALAADGQLKRLAEQDLARPADADDLLELADGWWTLAEHFEGRARLNLLRRAALWYQKAEPGLSGLNQAKARRRLEQLAELEAQGRKTTGQTQETPAPEKPDLKRSPISPPTSPRKTSEREPVPGYKYRQMNGFSLFVHNTVLENNEKSTLHRKPLDVLQLELDMVVGNLPPSTVAVLRRVPVWVQWNASSGAAVAQYHAGNKLNKKYSFASMDRAVKSNCIEILRMESLAAEHQGQQHRCILLHELAHAVHHHVFDYDNPVIEAAYAQAMSKGLYQGQYAATDSKEYFAEISCAYFGYLNYYPYTRADLKTYDPVGYEMMTRTWGTPEEIAKALRPEKEKLALAKFNAARKRLSEKTSRSEAVEMLKEILEDYPRTRGAKEASKLLAE